MSEETLLSPKQLANRYSWPIARIRTIIAKQQIRHIRIGGGLFLPYNAIEEYLSSNMVVPPHLQSAKKSNGTKNMDVSL